MQRQTTVPKYRVNKEIFSVKMDEKEISGSVQAHGVDSRVWTSSMRSKRTLVQTPYSPTGENLA
jgi:hypothetical protein